MPATEELVLRDCVRADIAAITAIYGRAAVMQRALGPGDELPPAEAG